MKPRSPVDPSLAYTDASEQQLKSLWHSYYPAASGPLSGMMQTVCALIESIAHLRGFDVSTWGEPS